MSNDHSLRHKTTALRRRHIVDAAVRVFSEKGYHRATIKDVAAAAGVADGTIYNVFENKTALLLGILDAQSGFDGDEPPLPLPGDALAMIETLIERQWRSFTPDRLAMMRVILSEVLVDTALRQMYLNKVIAPAVAPLEPLFSEQAKAGTLVTSDPAMTVRMLTGLFLGLVMLRLLGEERLEQEAEQVPALMSALLLDGLRPRSDTAQT